MKVVSNRKVDELGRIVLPIEFREYLGLKPCDPVHIVLDEDRLVIFPAKD